MEISPCSARSDSLLGQMRQQIAIVGVAIAGLGWPKLEEVSARKLVLVHGMLVALDPWMTWHHARVRILHG